MQQDSIQKDLEKLFINNSHLERINVYLSKFNPIKTMRMERMEIRHSAILAWLLDPQETHGFRDGFLKGFIATALRERETPTSPSALAVISSNLMSAEIRTDWRNIDILILIPDLEWVFIIENKFDSSLHSDQLNRYMQIVNDELIETTGSKYRHVGGIFLNLWGEDPQDERYAPILYSDLCELIQLRLSADFSSLQQETATFIRHYLEVIQEASGMSIEQNEIMKVARELYREHRRALEFIFRNGKVTDFGTACNNLFGDTESYPRDVMVDAGGFKVFNATSNTLSLLPKDWISRLEGCHELFEGCESWWAGFPFILWLELRKNEEKDDGNIVLFAEVGPISDHGSRCRLIEAINDISKSRCLERLGFQQGAMDEGKKYSRFLKKNKFYVRDIYDPELIASIIEKGLISFKIEMAAVGDGIDKYKTNK